MADGGQADDPKVTMGPREDFDSLLARRFPTDQLPPAPSRGPGDAEDPYGSLLAELAGLRGR